MIVSEKNINNKLYRVTSEEYLKEQAEALIELIGNIDSNKIKDGAKIHIGWNIYTIVKDQEVYCILAPDYAKNPFVDVTYDLTIPLWVQYEQSVLLKQLGIEGEMISFYDKVLCGKGVLAMDNIYLERNVEYKERDSGWYIGPVDETIDVTEYEAYYAYQLLGIRSYLIQVLSLPKGYVAVLEKDNIKAILDENDVDLLGI